jgi:NADH-quinone oxidoreductase subunit I
MNGMGIIRGLAVTLEHFVNTYVEDFRALRSRKKRTVAEKASADSRGLFTIEFPEEELAVPEEFRFMPFLVYEEGVDGAKNMRCTSCGICAKVCPPQCIWIVRTTDPNTGRPVPSPAEFFIDTDICMNCGLCAEYCPFDAIKMDHDFKISSYERTTENIFNLEKLSKPLSYYAKIRPQNYAREEAVRQADKEAKAARKAGTAAAN